MKKSIIELEQTIIGSMLLDENDTDKIMEKLDKKDFNLKKHKEIYETAGELIEKNYPVDYVSVLESLDKWNYPEDIADYLKECMDSVIVSGGVEYYLKRLKEISDTKQTRRVCKQYIGGDIEKDELIVSLENSDTIHRTGIKNIGEGIENTLDYIESLTEQDESFTGLKTGYPDIDHRIGGLRPGNYCVIGGRPSHGKCLGKGTKVVMYNGSLKKVENIKVNDKVMGVDNKPNRIKSTTKGHGNMYEIEQFRGKNYIVNEDHILSLKRSRNTKTKKHGEVKNITIKDYLNKSNKFKNNFKGYMHKGIEWPEKKLEIEPYFMGIWLGDGGSYHYNITTMDDSIKKYLYGYADRLGFQISVKKQENNKSNLYYLKRRSRKQKTSLPQLFKKYGFKNKGQKSKKRVPKEFKINSRKNRLELLAGIIDTDGYGTVYGTYEIGQKSKPLIMDIKYVANSLGFRTGFLTDRKKVYGENRTYYRLTISGNNLQDIPVKIKRKKKHIKKPKEYRDKSMSAISVKYLGKDDYYGFTLEKNGLFLLEDFTVTHNTLLGLNITRKIAKTHQKPILIFSFESRIPEIRERLLYAEGGVSENKIRNGYGGNPQWKKLTPAASRIKDEMPIYISDDVDITPTIMRSRARQFVRRHPDTCLILVDYLQEITGEYKNMSEFDKVTDASRKANKMAKELEVPVIAMSQLNRKVDSRAKDDQDHKKLRLADLRQTGQLEQDADIVMLLDYAFRNEPVEMNKNKLRVYISKIRNGPCGVVDLYFDPPKKRVTSRTDKNFI